MRHDHWDLEPELREVSEWVDWMEQELVPAGIDVPGASTCFKFSASSVRLALCIKGTYRHLPSTLRSRLIEASLLHQCWRRSVELSKKGRVFTSDQSLPVVEGRDFLGGGEGGHKLIVAADGHEYAVRFPAQDRGPALATEVIGFELARRLGLPTAPMALVAVNDHLAASAGFPVARPDCSAQRRGMSATLPCLGIRRVQTIETDDEGRPVRPLSARARSLLVGAAVLQILTADQSAQGPCFVAPKGHSEPVFNDYTRCLCGGDWERFLKEDYVPASVNNSVLRWVRSYHQLEHWIVRAESLDAERLCEMVIKLPSTWYGLRPMKMARVIERLGERARKLRHTVIHLIDTGFLPNMRRGPVAVRESTALSRVALAAKIRRA